MGVAMQENVVYVRIKYAESEPTDTDWLSLYTTNIESIDEEIHFANKYAIVFGKTYSCIIYDKLEMIYIGNLKLFKRLFNITTDMKNDIIQFPITLPTGEQATIEAVIDEFEYIKKKYTYKISSEQAYIVMDLSVPMLDKITVSDSIEIKESFTDNGTIVTWLPDKSKCWIYTSNQLIYLGDRNTINQDTVLSINLNDRVIHRLDDEEYTTSF